MPNTDAVLIVGAGPTGLTLANDLARRQVPFRIIDARPGPTSDSKGLALNISSQYGLKLIGLDGAVGLSGRSISRLSIHWNGRRYSSINFSHLKQEVRSLITQPQATTEAELIDQLELAGCKVLWSHKLVDLQESEDCVHATIQTPDARQTEEQYLYVVGCDGKFSKVRKQLNTSFTGTDYDMYFVLGDFELDLKLRTDEVHYHVYPDTFFILVPIAENTWRIVVKQGGAVPDSPVNPSELEPIIQRHFGGEYRLGKPFWLSRAPFYNRVAGNLGTDRLFIAGDAAHLFSPIGGTGMNTGIQDALNIGWKLAFVHHGHSHPNLLRSYEQERLPAIKAAAALSDLSTQLITRTLPDHPALDSLKPVMGNRSNLRISAPLVHSGLAQKIPVKEFSDPSTTSPTLGTFSRSLFAFIDALQDTQAHFADTRFWVMIDCDAFQLLQSHTSLSSLRRVIEQPQARIVYHYRGNSAPVFARPLDPLEHVFKLPDNFSKTHPLPAVEAVRPDGIVFYESSNSTLSNFRKAIEANFQFLIINHNSLDTANENVF